MDLISGRHGGRPRHFEIAFVLVLAVPSFATPPAPTLRLNADEASPHFATVEVHGFDAATLARLSRVALATHDWPAVLAVFTGSELPPVDGKPAVAGTWETATGVLRFRPRFPLVAGLSYIARFDPSPLRRIGVRDEDLPPPVVATFSLPKEELEPSTVVSAVYPSADELPENLLKLYLHFSAPMSRGEAYDHVRLLDAAGREVELPFLEIGEELWDSGMRRLTLFFDPGRIKRGLRPHLEAGPPLAEGASYRLAVDPAWRDAQGLQLARGFEKAFTVAAPDRESPDPDAWQLAVPAAGSREPLELRFPEPLDHGLLARVLRALDAAGLPAAGTVEVGDGERLWRFTPDQPWTPGAYAVEVETILEDLAGNSLKGVFDVDVTAPKLRDVEEKGTVSLGFRVAAP